MAARCAIAHDEALIAELYDGRECRNNFIFTIGIVIAREALVIRNRLKPVVLVKYNP